MQSFPSGCSEQESHEAAFLIFALHDKTSDRMTYAVIAGSEAETSLTSVVIELSLAVGEMKNAVGKLSSQAEAQTRALKEIRDLIIGARAILKFIGAVVGFLGLATLLKWWPIIHKVLMS